MLTPRRYKLSTKVSPFRGLPGSAGRTQGPVHTLLGPYRLAHDLSGLDGRLALVDFPADDLAAVESHDQVEGEEQPLDRPRQPADVPGPNLVGCPCYPPRRLAPGWWRAATAAVGWLIGFPQNAVKARLRGDIVTLIGQPGHDLARRPARLRRLVAEGQDLRPLFRAESSGRRWAHGLRAGIGFQRLAGVQRG